MTTSIDSLASLPDDELDRLCRRRAARYLAVHSQTDLDFSDEWLVMRVTAILRSNAESGRARRVIANDHASAASASAAWEAYVDRVIRFFLQEHRRVERLAEGDDEAWSQLQVFLVDRAAVMLYARQSNRSDPRQEAQDVTQQTCDSIFSSRFPFDVSFDAWATVILSNHVRKRSSRSPDALDRARTLESLDQAGGADPDQGLPLHELLPDPMNDTLFEQVEMQHVLLDAIARLGSLAQQQVIIYTYLYEMDDEDIALQLGRSRQAIYNLRHRARQSLREILREAFPQGTAARAH